MVEGLGEGCGVVEGLGGRVEGFGCGVRVGVGVWKGLGVVEGLGWVCGRVEVWWKGWGGCVGGLECGGGLGCGAGVKVGGCWGWGWVFVGEGCMEGTGWGVVEGVCDEEVIGEGWGMEEVMGRVGVLGEKVGVWGRGSGCNQNNIASGDKLWKHLNIRLNVQLFG